MSFYKVSIVTVNYNSSEYTKLMLESLEANKCFIDSIVIVDNNSEDSELDLLKDIVSFINSNKQLNVKLISSECNIGYFGGLNLGISNIDHSNIDGVIVCNNDIAFDNDFFNKLFSKKLEDNVYVVCPSVKTIDNIYQNPSMVSAPSFFRVFFYDLYYSNFYLGQLILKVWRALGLGIDSRTIKDYMEKEIFIGIGAIYYLTNNYFFKNKLLPNDTFLYGEEAFLSKQVRNSGGIQLYCPDLEVIHFESISTNKLPSLQKYELNKKAYQKYRSFFKQKIHKV